MLFISIILSSDFRSQFSIRFSEHILLTPLIKEIEGSDRKEARDATLPRSFPPHTEPQGRPRLT